MNGTEKIDPMQAPVAIGAGFFGGGGTPKALIGRGLDERSAQEILDRCLELGLRLIDTAHSYAGGESERIIGRWLARDPARRTRIAIIDKLGAFDRDGEVVADLAPATVARCVPESLSRLGVDAVDVLMPHGPDPATPVRDTLAALCELIDGGAARCWGVSNVTASGLEEWLTAARDMGVPGPALVENEFSLLARADEADVIPMCQAHGVGYLAYSPLAGGVLTGRYRRGEPPPPGSRLAVRPDAAASISPAVHDAVDTLTRHAHGHGLSAAGLALGWVLAANPVVRPIVGPSRLAHLDAVEQAMALQLPSEEWAAIASPFAITD